MKRTQYYLYAKKIHRLLVLAVLITGLVMVATGLYLYFGNYLSFDPITVRFLHHQLSVVFTIILGTMAITGLYLFIFPYLR